MFPVIFLATLLGVNESPDKFDHLKFQGNFSVQVGVPILVYDFKTEKWKSGWRPVRPDIGSFIHLRRWQRFAIRVESNHFHDCDMKIRFEGRDRGTWKIEPWQSIIIDRCDKNKYFVFSPKNHRFNRIFISFKSHKTKTIKTIKLNLIED